MSIFTIDEQHQVRAFPTHSAARAANRNQNGSFTTLDEFVKLVGRGRSPASFSCGTDFPGSRR